MISPIHGLHESLVKKDRIEGRASATTNVKKVHRNDRELIRSAYWEFSHILTKKDYKYALNLKFWKKGK
jgi:hypothetical protein